MENKFSKKLDDVADRLEAKGLIKEALSIDKIADQLSNTASDLRSQILFSVPNEVEKTLSKAIDEYGLDPEVLMEISDKISEVIKKIYDIEVQKRQTGRIPGPDSKMMTPGDFLTNQIRDKAY